MMGDNDEGDDEGDNDRSEVSLCRPLYRGEGEEEQSCCQMRRGLDS